MNLDRISWYVDGLNPGRPELLRLARDAEALAAAVQELADQYQALADELRAAA